MDSLGLCQIRSAQGRGLETPLALSRKGRSSEMRYSPSRIAREKRETSLMPLAMLGPLDPLARFVAGDDFGRAQNR